MSTPPRESILDNVQTVFEGITVANGYKSDTETVERLIRDWHNAHEGWKLWLGYMPQTQRFKHHAFNSMRVTMPLMIVAHVSGSTKDEATAAITNIEDDIIAALMDDPTRGGYATLTHIISQRDDIGDPDTMDSTGAGGTLEIIAEVVYHRTIGSS